MRYKNILLFITYILIIESFSAPALYAGQPSQEGLINNLFTMNLETSCRIMNPGDPSETQMIKVGDEATIIPGITFTTGSENPFIHIKSLAQIGLGIYTDSQGTMHPALSMGNPNEKGTFCIAINRTKTAELLNPKSLYERFIKIRSQKKSKKELPKIARYNLLQSYFSPMGSNQKFIPDSSITTNTLNAAQSIKESVLNTTQAVVETLAETPILNSFTTHGFLQYSVSGKMRATCEIGNFGEESEISIVRAKKGESITPGIRFTRGDAPLVSLSSIVEAGIGTYKDASGSISPSLSLRNIDNTGAVCLGINTQKLFSPRNWNKFLTNKYMPEGTVVSIAEPTSSAVAGGE